MSTRRISTVLSLALLLALIGCQAPVRPSIKETPAAVTEIAPVASKPLKPAASATLPAEAPPPPAEPTAMRSGAEVFDRLVAQMSPPICIKGPHNTLWRKRYAGHPASFAKRMEEILPLLAMVVEQVEAADLPGEFALIPLVESWYRPEAIGPGGPSGLWQMIAATGRHNGLRIDSDYDGRFSPLDSTDAALKHLSDMVEQFGDWRAAAMAYNAGEYRLRRALRHANDERTSGELRLPSGLSRTTYDYISKLQALSCLIAEPERHGLILPRDAHFEPLRAFALPAGITHLDQAARQLNLDAALLRRLNPAFRRGQVAASTPRRVLAPESAVIALTRIAADIPTSVAPDSASHAAPSQSPPQHTIQRGDTLSALAKRYGVSVSELAHWNAITPRTVLQIGQSLRVGN